MKIYTILTFLIVCFFHQSIQAQCNFGVADNTSNTYNYAIVSGQSFTANCSGSLQNITFTVSGQVLDDLRGSGFFVSARVKNASGTILGNATFSGSATQTDQWYSGATIVANFLNANILLQSGSIYTFEVVETSNSFPLYLFKTTSSSVYSGGNYIADGVQKPNQDLIGWTVNVQAVPTPPTPSSTFYVSAGGSVTTKGSSIITLNNTKFTNNGTYAGTSGTVQIIGSNSNANTTIEGTGITTFNNLTINKSSNNAQLNQNVAVTGNLTLTSGGVMLNSGNINFGSTGSLQNETEINRVFGTGGYLQTTVNLNAPNATNPANLGAIITSTANLGSTIIKRAHSSFTLNGNGINRSFDITPTNNTGLNATLKFNYLDAELNGNSEDNLALWKSTNAGTNWTALASTSNATSNFVQSTGIPSFALFSVGANAVVNTPNPPTNVTANSTSICIGSSVSLSGACNSGVLTWYDVSSGGTAIGTNTPLLQSPTANITYFATCNDGANESERVSTGLITVNALPTATASSNSPICAGTSLNLLGGVQGNNQSLVSTETYSWTGVNSFSSTLQNPSILSATTLASGTYQVTVTNSNGCTATATTSVIVNALPTATASSNSPICAGTTLNLFGGIQGNNQSLISTETYSWTGVNSFSSTLQNPSISSATTLASGTYKVTVTDVNGCTASATTSVIVNALPTATASSNSPICAGTTLNLLGGVQGNTPSLIANETYAWTGANSFSSTLQNPSISSATTLASGTYQVMVTNSNGCTATATTSVIVNALPTATASSNSPICAGTTLNLLGGVQGNTPSLIANETYAWTGANSFSSTLQNPSISSATTLSSGTYQVTVTNSNGCTATATTAVIVNPTPVTPTTQADAQIIFGGGISLTATGCEGTIKWYQKLDDALVTMPVSPTATTQYYAKCEITSNGITCISEKSNDVTVTVLKPTPPVATGATICVGTGVTLTATGCSGEVGIFTLKWYQKADSILVSMPVSPTVSTDYFAKCEHTFNGVTAISGKSNFVTLVVLNPSIPAVSGVTIYKGNSTSLVATGCTGEGFTVKWYETTTNNLVMMPVSPSITTKYYAKCEQIANNVTCISNKSDDVTITVVNRIFVDITKASLPSQNGTSWAMAYGDLQQGLAQAIQGIQNELTEVWVAKGTYNPTATTNRNLSFVIPSGVKIYGGFSGTEDELNARNFRTNPTILSGEIGSQQAQNDNSYHVVVFDGSNANTLFDGFTITGGFANFYTEKSGTGSLISSSLTTTIERGGGMLLKSGSKPLIINCTFTNNAATTGGAIYANESAPQIINCKFMGNQGTFGSAIYLESNSNAKIENSLFSGNRGIGTLYNNYSNPILSNCTFGGNGGYNGCIFNSNSQPTVTNSILWGNTTPLNDTLSIISYSIVQGGYAGVGNLNFDPQFVSQTPEGLSPNLSGDYHLKPSSLAIDRGNNGSISLTDLDLDGNLRRFNAGRVDMGAFEFQGNSVSSVVISVSSGNWEINSTWDAGRVPKIGDLVIIDNNHTVNLNAEGAAKNIEYRGTGTLKFNSTNSKLNLGF